MAPVPQDLSCVLGATAQEQHKPPTGTMCCGTEVHETYTKAQNHKDFQKDTFILARS